ncbi:MAG TPA: hypothetical protein PK880_03600 [Candidatus Competibacter sp.]|nr:hypothetical protein [Candidatus Competibacteraceae bacterium]HRC71601.1 hypothetical protein [Candidatus Competibacter sp.]
MRIEAELDEIHAERLLRLQQTLQKPMAEIVAEAIDALNDATLAHQETHGEQILRIMNEEGLIGCMEGDGNLSVDYKKYLWDSET